MAGIAKKNFEAPDEQRNPDKTTVQVVDLGSVKAARDHPSARLALVGMHQARRRNRELPDASRGDGGVWGVGGTPQ